MKKSLGAKTIAYPTPVFVIGTYDKDDKPNMMTVAWAGISCSSPACMSVSVRKATYSYACIVDRKAFTVNIPSEDYYKHADYVGIFSGKDHDKFSDISLTPVRSDLIDAPFISEFPVNIECKLIHTIELGLHTQFIGEIVDVKADESIIAENGFPDILKVRPVVFAPGSRTYYGIGKYIGKAFSAGKEIGPDKN